jgi:hypothetical protein
MNKISSYIANSAAWFVEPGPIWGVDNEVKQTRSKVHKQKRKAQRKARKITRKNKGKG